MRVFILATGADTGGTAVRIKHAFDRYDPETTIRAMHASETYIQYPTDLRYREGLAHRLVHTSDVIHLQNTMYALRRWPRDFDGRGVVVHHHGTAFRSNHVAIAQEAIARNVLQLVSTMDLHVLEPSTRWCPSPYDLDWLAARRNGYEPTDEIVVAQAPTDRRVKSTGLVIAAVERLQEQGTKVRLDLIEQQPWFECLNRKAKADILVDQIGLGYGNNAIEAWGIGLPVIAGTADPDVRKAMVARWGSLPFYEATEESLPKAIEKMVNSRALREEWAGRGKEHVERWHSSDKVVTLLKGVYAESIRATVHS